MKHFFPLINHTRICSDPSIPHARAILSVLHRQFVSQINIDYIGIVVVEAIPSVTGRRTHPSAGHMTKTLKDVLLSVIVVLLFPECDKCGTRVVIKRPANTYEKKLSPSHFQHLTNVCVALLQRTRSNWRDRRTNAKQKWMKSGGALVWCALHNSNDAPVTSHRLHAYNKCHLNWSLSIYRSTNANCNSIIRARAADPSKEPVNKRGY